MASILPSLAKTWSIGQNQTVTSGGTLLADTQNMMLLFINQLITWGWTVVGSGSTNYGSGANDGTNRFRTTADMVASAWITLSNSTMGVSLQMQHNASNNGQWTWKGSYAGFTGGSLSSTVAGTASDSFACNTAGGTSFPFAGSGTFATVCKWHSWKSSDNYVHQVVVYVASVPVFWFRAEKATNAPAGFPVATITVNDEGAGTTANKMLVTAVAFYAYYNAAARTYGYMQVSIGSNATQGLAVAIYDSNYMISPIGVASTTAAILGMGFWCADLYLVASSLQEGAAMPASGARTWVVCGDLLLPWTDVAMQIT
jgi:hypothetical protein